MQMHRSEEGRTPMLVCTICFRPMMEISCLHVYM